MYSSPKKNGGYITTKKRELKPRVRIINIYIYIHAYIQKKTHSNKMPCKGAVQVHAHIFFQPGRHPIDGLVEPILAGHSGPASARTYLVLS